MAIWTPEDVIHEEMAAYDDLPVSVRKFLAYHNANIPATRLLEVYIEKGYDEEALWKWIRQIKILHK